MAALLPGNSSLATHHSSLLFGLLHHHPRAILQFPTDRAVAARDHFVARFDPAFYFDVGVIRNASRDLDHFCFAALLQENNFLQFLALFLHGLFRQAFVFHLGVVVGFLFRLVQLLFPLDLFRAQVGIASANSDALHRDRDHIFHHRGLDIGGAAQAGTKTHPALIEPDFYLEVGHFLLRAGAGRFAGVRDLFHRAAKFSVAIGIDRHLGG